MELTNEDKKNLNRFIGFLYQNKEINIINDPTFTYLNIFMDNKEIKMWDKDHFLNTRHFYNYKDILDFYNHIHKDRITLCIIVCASKNSQKTEVSFENGKMSDFINIDDDDPCNILYVTVSVKDRFTYFGKIYDYLMENIYINPIFANRSILVRIK